MTVAGGWSGGSQIQRQGKKHSFIYYSYSMLSNNSYFVSYSVADRQKSIIVSSFRLFSSTSESSFCFTNWCPTVHSPTYCKL